jgi:hypothetical protein
MDTMSYGGYAYGHSSPVSSNSGYGKSVIDKVKNVFKTKSVHGGPQPKWNSSEPYDIKDNDHVTHVTAKLHHDGTDKDLEIVLPKPNQLQLDYDSPKLPERFGEALDLLTQAYCKVRESLVYTVTVSKSGNRHVTIDLPASVSPTERIAWQAIFGSDYKREGLGMMSIVRGIANPSLLIEKKGGKPIQTGLSIMNERPVSEGRMFRRGDGESRNESADSARVGE